MNFAAVALKATFVAETSTATGCVRTDEGADMLVFMPSIVGKYNLDMKYL